MAVNDKKQSFYGQRSLYRAYLNGEVKNILDHSWIYQKQGTQYEVRKVNIFTNYYKVLSESGWKVSWESPNVDETCFVSTPEGYCLGCELKVNDKIAWLLSPPTSKEALKSLINSILAYEATEVIESKEVTKSKKVIEPSLGKDYHVKTTYISSENVSSFVGKIKLLLVTATEIETKTLRTYLNPLQGHDAILEGTIDDITYRLGKFGEYNAVHFQCAMGTVGRDSSLLSTYIAIKFWEPTIVLMVGIAFGGNPHKMQLGDVLVSEMISPYEPARVGETIIPRGPSSLAGSILLNHFRNMIDWEYPISSAKLSEKRIGEILSGEKLVDNLDFKNQLLTLFPNAIGGEMEGAGIYAAATRAKVSEWILVKGICDWGDGTKTKEYQPLAADAALSLCHAVFSNPHSFEFLPKEIECLPITNVEPYGNSDQSSKVREERTSILASDIINPVGKSNRYQNRFSLKKYYSERDPVTDMIIGLNDIDIFGKATINYTLPDGEPVEEKVKNGYAVDFNFRNNRYRLLVQYVNLETREIGVEIAERL
ncbi:hypothetical protein [Pelosinus sp. UFO1]|uniref:5'-methylthioadenosine/S-adenosylhomocysteine nucleosidase family protein n=1 Tax=Pelosinus sp. UFO1 TaxID=484770 RepID=UPI0004D1C383|nr:hypothetical protein [Pelosinus sp. UFO1]AIF52882.1 hypothetical protein UFO1_3339 [Pelosinus sp. UFO1]